MISKIKEDKNINNGFTIVELLVVIVIIGILAVITIVSYTGISKKANESVIISDLANNKKKMALYFAQYGSYPTSLDVNNCASLPNPDINYCLKFSPGVSLGSYVGSVSSFSMSANGNGVTFEVTDSSVPAVAMIGWKQLSAGYNHTCGISTDDKAYCWGWNQYGQLGNNSTADSLTPVAVDKSGVLNGKNILSISAGFYHTCVVASDNLAYCWGINSSGELGNGLMAQSNIPTAVVSTGVLSGKTVKKIFAGFGDACVIASDNQAYCWGGNTNGALGNNSSSQTSVPVAVYTSGVLSGKTILSIALGSTHSCAIASNNLAYCWGGAGRIGNGTSVNSLVPVAVSTAGVLSGKTIKSITANWAYTCAIASDDQAYCWGWGGYGQLGNNSTADSTVPVAVTTTGVLSGKTLKSISAGTNSHTCATASDNQVYCWGNNDKGQFGNNTTGQSSVPVATTNTGVLSGKSISNVLSGGCYTLAIGVDGRVYAWGDNAKGQFGNNTTINSLLPVTAF